MPRTKKVVFLDEAHLTYNKTGGGTLTYKSEMAGEEVIKFAPCSQLELLVEPDLRQLRFITFLDGGMPDTPDASVTLDRPSGEGCRIKVKYPNSAHTVTTVPNVKLTYQRNDTAAVTNIYLQVDK